MGISVGDVITRIRKGLAYELGIFKYCPKLFRSVWTSDKLRPMTPSLPAILET